MDTGWAEKEQEDTVTAQSTNEGGWGLSNSDNAGN